MSTPAQEQGFEVGESYQYSSSKGLKGLRGEWLEFKSDDGSGYPAFFVPPRFDPDGWMFLSLDNFSPSPKRSIVEDTETPRACYTVSVTGGITSVSFTGKISLATVQQLIDVVEGK